VRDWAKWSTAFHEAGHAVACWRCGVKVRRATIVPAEDSLGQVKHSTFFRGINLDTDNSARGDRQVKDLVIVCLAGPEAQRRYRPYSVRHAQCSADYRQAADLALKVNGSDKATKAYLRWLEIVTRDSVALWWPQIEKVARALFERGTLTATEIETELASPRRGHIMVLNESDAE
jgi:hypothetical protein